MYPVLLVNQDGSTYTIRHRSVHSHTVIYPFSHTHTNNRSPLRILTLPLDPSTLSAEEREERERIKQAAKERVYIEEDMDDEGDSWDQDQYRDLINR